MKERMPTATAPCQGKYPPVRTAVISRTPRTSTHLRFGQTVTVEPALTKKASSKSKPWTLEQRTKNDEPRGTPDDLHAALKLLEPFKFSNAAEAEAGRRRNNPPYPGERTVWWVSAEEAQSRGPNNHFAFPSPCLRNWTQSLNREAALWPSIAAIRSGAAFVLPPLYETPPIVLGDGLHRRRMTA